MNINTQKNTVFTIFIIFSVVIHSQTIYSHAADFNRKILYNNSDEAKDNEIRYSLNPTNSILRGALAGCLFGMLIGKSIPASSYASMSNCYRGAYIGLFTSPFFHYEISRGINGISNKRNRWAFCFGSNLTYTNYKDAEIKTGISSGINRYYYLNNRFDLIYCLFYNINLFKIPDKIIHYFWLTPYKIANNDIEFSAHYIDISLLLNCKFNIPKVQFNIGIGPFTSIQILDNTKYITYWEKEIYSYDRDVKYDYYYNDDEIQGTGPYVGYSLNLGIVIDRAIIQIDYKKSLQKSVPIYALSPGTELNKIDFVLGYYLD